MAKISGPVWEHIQEPPLVINTFFAFILLATSSLSFSKSDSLDPYPIVIILDPKSLLLTSKIVSTRLDAKKAGTI